MSTLFILSESLPLLSTSNQFSIASVSLYSCMTLFLAEEKLGKYIVCIQNLQADITNMMQ